MDPKIRAMLDLPVDYSEDSDAEARRLGAMVGEAIGCKVHYEFSGNYNYCDSLSFFSDARGRRDEIDGASLWSRFFVNARCKVFMLRTLFLCTTPSPFINIEPPGRPYWRLTMPYEVAEVARDLHRIAEDLLIENGYQNLDGDVLEEMAEGHFTDLDGKPATVGEVLYGELIP